MTSNVNADYVETTTEVSTLEDLAAQDELNQIIMEGTTSTTAAVLVPSEQEQQQDSNTKDWFALWTKRLITSEDAFSIHKLSGLVYTLSSIAMMGIAAQRWLIGRQELFATIPDSVEPLLYLFCASNLTLCLASIRMAWIHRRTDLASRNAFVGTAGSSLFSGYFLWWASPFASDAWTTPLASQVGFGILVAWNVLFVTDTVLRATDIIKGRQAKRSQEERENASYAWEYVRYIASGAWGLPVVAVTGYICCVLHDHDWITAVFQHNYDTYGHGLQASVFYNNILASWAPAYGSLFVTLRDKKLISKQTEWIGIAAFAIPALIWTIDVTVRVLPYWTGEGITLVEYLQ